MYNFSIESLSRKTYSKGKQYPTIRICIWEVTEGGNVRYIDIKEIGVLSNFQKEISSLIECGYTMLPPLVRK